MVSLRRVKRALSEGVDVLESSINRSDDYRTLEDNPIWFDSIDQPYIYRKFDSLDGLSTVNIGSSTIASGSNAIIIRTQNDPGSIASITDSVFTLVGQPNSRDWSVKEVASVAFSFSNLASDGFAHVLFGSPDSGPAKYYGINYDAPASELQLVVNDDSASRNEVTLKSNFNPSTPHKTYVKFDFQPGEYVKVEMPSEGFSAEATSKIPETGRHIDVLQIAVSNGSSSEDMFIDSSEYRIAMKS